MKPIRDEPVLLQAVFIDIKTPDKLKKDGWEMATQRKRVREGTEGTIVS